MLTDVKIKKNQNNDSAIFDSQYITIFLTDRNKNRLKRSGFSLGHEMTLKKSDQQPPEQLQTSNDADIFLACLQTATFF